MSQPERREKPRVPFKDAVKVHRVQPSKSGHIFEVSGDPIPAKGQDINENGLCLNVDPPPEPQSILKVNFEVAEKAVDVYARVVWADVDRCGLRFIVLDKPGCRAIKDYMASPGN
jgi:hypothetical protein